MHINYRLTSIVWANNVTEIEAIPFGHFRKSVCHFVVLFRKTGSLYRKTAVTEMPSISKELYKNWIPWNSNSPPL